MDKIIDVIGKAVSWLSVSTVMTTFLVVVLSYLLQKNIIRLDVNLVALQELVVYMHATLFMLGLSFAMRHNRHVRIDIIYNRLEKKTGLWIDVAGTFIFLIPVCVFLLMISYDYVIESWKIREASREAGGIPAVYLLKSLLLIAPVLLVMQGLADVVNKISELNTISRGGNSG